MLSCELKKLDQDWRNLLAPCLGENFDKPIVKRIDDFLSSEHPHFVPSKENMLRPFEISVKDIRVIIVGNCPNPSKEYATGLPFSSPPNIKMGTSVEMIFKAIIVDIYGINHNDEKKINKKMPSSGCLEYLLDEGVFLINRTFTNTNSGDEHIGSDDHIGQGWEKFSEVVINLLSKELDSSIFMLWGSYAKKLRECIDEKKQHLVLEAYHPAQSSFSSSYCEDQDLIRRKHFSQANDHLKKKGKGKPIKWLNN